MELDEYIKDGDPNKFWRLSDGDRDNLMDDAIDRIEQLQTENRNLRAALESKHPNTCPLCEGDGEWDDNGNLRVCPCCHGKGTI